MAQKESGPWSEAERDAFEETRELDERNIAGGGLVRAMYNFKTETPYIELEDRGLNVTWAIAPDKVMEAIHHPYAVAPIGLIVVREAFEE